MFGPIPTYDPLLGEPLPFDSIPTNNRNTMENDDNDLPGGGDLPDQPTFENMNRAALLAWQERQRRQRTLRMLMMFLMVLLLMDGDEPPNSRKHHRTRQHLRHDRSKGHWEKLGYMDDQGNVIGPLHPEVYRSRMEEDEAILRALKDNADSRYHDLVKKNNGMNIQDQLEDLIRKKLHDEAAKGLEMDGMNSMNQGDDFEVFEDGKIVDANEVPPIIIGVDRSDHERAHSVVTFDDAANELDDMIVFHYPRNATGYYRGMWVRTSANKTSHDSDNNNADLIAAAAAKQNIHHLSGGDQTNTVQHNVTSEDVSAWAQATLSQRKDDVSLLFLPPDIFVEPDATIAKNSTSGADTKSSPTSGWGQTNSFASTPLPTSKQPSLSLTKEAGRAAFQLYSRPIPAMNELSIVDGLVKLYDGMTTSFVSRRTDVLLRVRGVMIHGIGKMSLVTSSPMATQGGTMGKRRTVLGIRKVADKDLPPVEEFHAEEVENSNLMDDVEGSQSDSFDRRRRLEIAVEQLISGSGENADDDPGNSGEGIDATITQIRKDAMDLYPMQYINLSDDELNKLKNNEGMRNSIESEGWTRLQSIDEVEGPATKNLEELFRNEPAYRNLGGDNDEDYHEYAATAPDSSVEHANGTTHSSIINASMPVNHFGMAINGTDLAWRRSTMTLSAIQELSATLRYVYPYPYVTDDAEESIKKVASPASRMLPGREQALEANAANCEFEMNIDVQSTKWTFGEWRTSMEYRMRMEEVFNPYWNIANSGGESVKLKRSQYLLMVKSQLEFLEKETPKESLVMTMVGDIHSKNCDFHSFVNVTAMRTNWEHTTAKAINYSFYMMLTCLTQIVILLRQLLHTQSQSVASNVSLLCIGWQTVLDAILCISHIFLCLVMQPLFTAFASVAFFKLLIFCVIEMKYMAIIIQARNNANNTGLTQEDLRRQVTLLHLKFYGALMSAIIAFWYFGQSNRTLYVLLLYSFWVPQIILNIITESRKPMHPYYMYGMSLTRTVAPIYVFAVQNNFLKEVNPDFPTEPKMCQLLLLWIAVQTAILYAQSKYGTRFMIPQRFLPPKFDYSRPIPPSLLPRPASNTSNGSTSEIELGPLLNSDTSPSRERSNGVARNRRGGGNRTRLGSSADVTGGTSMSEDTRDTPTLDCVICYNEIDVNDRKGYMLAPCDHIFHRRCLEQWMDVKMECPICRCNLPSI